MKTFSEMVNENQYQKEKREHRAYSAEQLSQLGITLSEGGFTDAKQIVDWFYSLYRMYCKTNDKRSKYYCGITDDIIRRKSEHESEDYAGKLITKVYLVKCKDVDTAGMVEEMMRDLGFDTGDTETSKNGAADDTDFVYFYRKP